MDIPISNFIWIEKKRIGMNYSQRLGVKQAIRARIVLAW